MTAPTIGDHRLPERFWAKVVVGPEPAHLPHLGACWLWTGTKSDGYGQIRANGKKVLVHRLAFAALMDPIPNGLCVLHRCDIRACVRISHLFAGTVHDNNLDMIAKGRDRSIAAKNRTKATCPNGHPLSGLNLRACDLKRGERSCLTCYRARDRASYARRRSGMRAKTTTDLQEAK